VTVGGKGDKVKPNGKTGLSRTVTGLALRITIYPPPADENPAVIRCHVAAGTLREHGGPSSPSGSIRLL
jgi:hypothetical protein